MHVYARSVRVRCARSDKLVCVQSLLLSSVSGFFFQAEDGIRDLVRSRGLGDVYKRQVLWVAGEESPYIRPEHEPRMLQLFPSTRLVTLAGACLLYTSDAADERSSVDLGGRRIIKKKKRQALCGRGGDEEQGVEGYVRRDISK